MGLANGFLSSGGTDSAEEMMFCVQKRLYDESQETMLAILHYKLSPALKFQALSFSSWHP